MLHFIPDVEVFGPTKDTIGHCQIYVTVIISLYCEVVSLVSCEIGTLSSLANKFLASVSLVKSSLLL